MESKKRKKDINLLPNSFKKIGFAVMILSFVPFIVFKATGTIHTQVQKDLWFVFSFNFFLLGLLFIALSKDKVEDELTMAIRVRSMAFAFIWVVLIVIIKPVVDWIFKDSTGTMPGQQLIMSMLLFYLLTYYSNKRWL